jgi:hypothetical protein
VIVMKGENPWSVRFSYSTNLDQHHGGTKMTSEHSPLYLGLLRYCNPSCNA